MGKTIKEEKKKRKKNSKRKRMISCSKKKIALLIGITSKHGFHCVNCIHSFRTKSKLESLQKLCINTDFWHVVMPSEDTKH